MKKIFIYGSGYYGSQVFKKIKKKFQIVGFIDSDKRKINKKKHGKKIYPIEILKKKTFFKIFIASMWSSDIYNSLISKKIPKNKIYIYPASLVNKNQKKKVNWHVILKELIKIFDYNKIHYHLDHSSLLGLIRDGNVYDSDIDIAVNIDQLSLIKKILIKSKKINKIDYGIIDVEKKGFGKKFLYQLKLNNLIDLHIKKKIKKKYFWIVGSNILNCEEKFFSITKKIKFKNLNLKIPFFHKKYLINLYGKSWVKPQLNWTHNDYENIFCKIKFKNFKKKTF